MAGLFRSLHEVYREKWNLRHRNPQLTIQGVDYLASNEASGKLKRSKSKSVKYLPQRSNALPTPSFSHWHWLGVSEGKGFHAP